MIIAFGYPFIKEERIDISLSGLISPIVVHVTSQDMDFPCHMPESFLFSMNVGEK